MPAPKHPRLPAYPVISRCITLGGWAFPSWWAAAVIATLCGLLLAVLGIINRLPVWLPQDSLIDQIDPAWVFSIGAGLAFSSVLILALHLRRNTAACTRIFADRIEQNDGKGGLNVLYWHELAAPSGTWPGDVRLETVGSGDSSHEEIRLDRRQKGQAEAFRLYCSLHPLGRPSPTFSNVTALRQAFLLSLQMARPELHVAADLWALCELHPATLQPDKRPKYFFRLSIGVILLLSGLFASTRDIHARPLWSLAETLGVFMLLTLVLHWLQTRLFAQTDDPEVVACRNAALDNLRKAGVAQSGKPQGS